MSQLSKPGQIRSAAIMITLSLIAGITAISILFVLKSREAKQSPEGIASSAINLSLPSMDLLEIQNWIKMNMAKRHAKISVVNIWATWCEPCREEMPELVKFQKTNLAPLFLISADNESDRSIIRSFLIQNGVDFESVLVRGDQQKFIEGWQKISALKPSQQWSMTLPATFLIAADGRVISFAVGTTTSAALTALVKKTLDTLRD